MINIKYGHNFPYSIWVCGHKKAIHAIGITFFGDEDVQTQILSFGSQIRFTKTKTLFLIFKGQTLLSIHCFPYSMRTQAIYLPQEIHLRYKIVCGQARKSWDLELGDLREKWLNPSLHFKEEIIKGQRGNMTCSRSFR